jgi:hypothetical protein
MNTTNVKYSQDYNDENFFEEISFETFYSNKVIKGTSKTKKFKSNYENDKVDYFQNKQRQKKQAKRATEIDLNNI